MIANFGFLYYQQIPFVSHNTTVHVCWHCMYAKLCTFIYVYVIMYLINIIYIYMCINLCKYIRICNTFCFISILIKERYMCVCMMAREIYCMNKFANLKTTRQRQVLMYLVLRLLLFYNTNYPHIYFCSLKFFIKCMSKVK